MVVWSRVSQNSATWTEIADVENVVSGTPMGLLLTLTYPATTILTSWSNVTKNSDPTWSNISVN
jgi:hypothetical protein